MKYTIKERLSGDGIRRFYAYDDKDYFVGDTCGNTVEECETKLRNVLNPARVVKEIEVP